MNWWTGEVSRISWLKVWPTCGPIVVKLVEAGIGLGEEIAVADLGVVVVAVGGDRRHGLRAELEIALQREAVAGLLGAGDEILVDRAARVALGGWQGRGDRAGDRLAGGVERGRADHLGAAIVIILVIVGDEGELRLRGRLPRHLRAAAIMFVAIDLVADRLIVDIAVVMAVEAGEAGLAVVSETGRLTAPRTRTSLLVKKLPSA